VSQLNVRRASAVRAVAFTAVAVTLALVLPFSNAAGEKPKPPAVQPTALGIIPSQENHVVGRTPEEAGRYLIRAGGCNDCHTPGFMQKGEQVPESLWLTGVPVGWRGPWGTTYASNLRLFIKPFTEEQFVEVIRKRNSRPPMVWPALHAMSDRDLKAIYRYIKSLGDAGQPMPDYVPPGQEPKTPYLNLMPVVPAAATAASAKAES
jgi:hypothetical protein